MIYAVRDEGILATIHSASPIASDGRICLAAGRTFAQAARNDMGETVMATPAIANNTLYLRTAGHVYAIGKTAANAPAD